MTEDGKIYYDVVDSCFQELHDISSCYLEDGYDDETFAAGIFLISNNIVAWARLYNVNVEQFMEQTFEEICGVVHKLEREEIE